MIAVYLVLAAGSEGPRWALTEDNAETHLVHHVHAAQLARMGGPVVVLGSGGDSVVEAHEDFPIQWVQDPAADASAGQAVRLGLAKVPPANAALVTPADSLPPRIDTFDLLAEALEQLPEGQIGVRAVTRDRPGYPVLLLPEAVREISERTDLTDFGGWLSTAAAQDRLQLVSVDDDHVLRPRA